MELKAKQIWTVTALCVSLTFAVSCVIPFGVFVCLAGETPCVHVENCQKHGLTHTDKARAGGEGSWTASTEPRHSQDDLHTFRSCCQYEGRCSYMYQGEKGRTKP